MDPLNEKTFDFVLIGTGFVESILSGALSRAGKSVLQLDPNEYYGGNEACFPLKHLTQRLNESKNTNNNDDEKEEINDEKCLYYFFNLLVLFLLF